jgi:concanavalin A-like lectin/glucanase superfamily protein
MNPPVFPRRLQRSLRTSAAVVLTALLAAILPIGAPIAHAAGNQAVHFDGTDDHVKIGTGGAGTGPNPSEFTVELWFNWNGGGTTMSTGTGGTVAIPLVSKGRAEGETVAQDVNYFLGIDASNRLVADFEQFGTTGGGIQGGNHLATGTVTPVTTNAWHHAAATYSTAGGWGLYLDGASVLASTPLGAGFVPNTGNTSPAAIGSSYLSTGVQGTTNGPGFFAGDTDEVRIWNTARSQGQISGAMNTEITSAAGLIDRWGMNEGSGTTAADSAGSTPGVLTNGPTWVAGAPALNAPPPPLTNPSLGFNGTNQYVTFGQASGLGAAQFTLEAWFNKSGAGTPLATTGTSGLTNVVPLLAKGRNESDGSNVDMNYFLGIDSAGHLAADFEDMGTGLNHPITGTAVIANGAWHHAAATYDGTTWRLYLDGTPDGSPAVANATPRSDSIQHASLGSALNSTGVASGWFAGTIDEARIWNFARAEGQIQATMNNEVPTATGLIGRWGMNETSGSTIADSSGSSVTGDLVGTPTRVEGPVLTPVTPNDPPVVDTVAINEATPRTNDTLTVAVTSHDPNNDTVTYTYQWLKDGSDIPAATGATLDMSIGGRGDRGEQMSVRVTGHDPFTASAPVTSSAVAVLNTAPSTTVVFDNSNPGTNDILTATASPVDVDASDTVSLTYEWRVNGTLRRTTATTALTDTFDLSQPNNGNTGDVISVTVTPSDGTNAGSPAVANATVVDALKLPNFLPEETWQTNDRVTTIQRVGNVVYLGGKFTQVMDHSGTTAARNRLAAFDALTGNLLPWNPNANGVIWSLDASADGQTIYVSGAFKKVGGVSHQRVAAVNATGAGAVLPWAPFVDGVVRGVTVSTGGTVYLGGAFLNANGMPRNRLAAVNGTNGNLLAWNPNADNLVRAVDIDQAGRVIAGGSFMNAGGSAQARVAILDPTSGVAHAFAGPRPTTTVTDIAVGDDPSSFYVTFNNVINAYTSATGARRWSEGGDGNVQGLDVQDGLLYIGGHFHVFNSESRVYLASAKTSDGSLTPWTAHANSVLGVFAVEASTNRLYIGGDFTDVSGQTQQHFAMFAVQDNTSPTRPGQPTGVSNTSSTIDLSWVASTDAGNPTLTYYVYRDALANPVGSVVSSSTTTVSFVDTGLAPLSTHTYRIQASDGVLASSFSDPSAPIQVMNGTDTAAPVLQSLVMQDQDTDGLIDRLVATFDESLAPYSAGNAPWTLTNVPSGGTLSGVNVSGNQATLQITEGAGAQDTAVGTFTIALAANPNGIRDAAGNQSMFTARAPTDGAGAVPTNIIRTAGSTSGLIQPGDTVTITFSESMAPATVPAVTTITESDPSGPGNDSYEFNGITAGPIVLNSDTYVGADGTSASFANSAVTLNNGRNVKITVGSTCSGSGCASLGVGGQAAIMFIPATTLQDSNDNPAVGQITKTFRLF